MAKRAVTVTINRAGFEATETFTSEADALAWRDMVGITLDQRAKASFDLAVYAQGLAESVRTHGGAYIKAKWVDVEVPTEHWIRGLPAKLDHEAMVRDVLPERPLKPSQAYGRKA